MDLDQLECKICGIKYNIYFKKYFGEHIGICDDCWEKKYIFDRGDDMPKNNNGEMVYGKDFLEKMERDRQRRQEEAFINAFKPDIEVSATGTIKKESDNNPLTSQVGGDHYKNTKIQPAEYAHANKLDFFQGSVIKYITRFRQKNGLQDLEKAKHFIDLLIKLEYGDKESK